MKLTLMDWRGCFSITAAAVRWREKTRLHRFCALKCGFGAFNNVEGIIMENSGVMQPNMLNKKLYSAPRLISYGSVAKLTKAKSGGTSDNGGGKGQNLPPIRRY
jgi:hypothetical protein